MDNLFSFVDESRSCAVDELHAHTAIYTTRHVVTDILNRAGWPQCSGDLIDPSAGDGAFLVEALAMLDLGAAELAKTERVFGMEIHPGAVTDARDRLASFFLERGCCANSARSAAERIVVEGDFLADPLPAKKFQKVISNPPYLRFFNLPPLFKHLYTKRVPKHALADLQHAFLDRCRSLLTPDGEIGFVTADRWLMNSTAAELRENLGRDLGIAHLSRLDPATSFYRPKTRKQGSPPRIHPVEILLNHNLSGQRLTRAPICPDGEHSDDLSDSFLGDIASVRIAPWLGPLGLWVVPAAIANLYPEGDWIPAIDTDDLNPDNTLRPPTRMALRTFPDLMPGSPGLAWHLWKQRCIMPKREGTRPWWMPPETITLPLDQPFLLIPRIARSLRVIEVPSGYLPINHNLSVVAAPGTMSLAQLKELLTADRSQNFIKRHAPRLENGFYSITTTLLRRLPV